MPRLALVAVPLIAALATPAYAYQIETPATTGCHERITARAVRLAGFPDGQVPPAPTDYQQRVIRDVPFSFPLPGTEDAWNLALLIGVRNNDIEDNDPIDLAALSAVHNDPLKQVDHCLRHIEDDTDAGNAAARARCKEFILAELGQALGEGDTVDMTAEIEVKTSLKFRDSFEIRVQRFGFHTGRALHALQDGFTHTFRNPDTLEIRTVLNWIEGNIGKNYDEARDGHEHVGGIDDCTRTDAASRNRETAATAASNDLLAALADPSGGRAGRLARAGAVIDRALAAEEGCNLENSYCDAAELEITSCSTGGGAAGWLPLAGVLGLFAVGGRRRRRRPLVIAATAASVLILAAPAFAQPAPTATNPVPGEKEETEGVGSEAPKSDETEEKVIEREDAVLEALPDPTTKPWGIAANIGGAYDRGALHATIGARWNPNDCLAFGLDVEWNPWLALSELDAVPGALNIYIPIIWKLRKFGSWELRSTWGLGASVLLSDLVEVDKFSVGPFVSWNPLGVAFTVSPNFKVVVKPGDIVVPIPEVTGFPFYYHQYRFTVGFEWYP